MTGQDWREDALHRARLSLERRVQRELNGSLRDELLNDEIFYSLAEATVLIEAQRRQYNTLPDLQLRRPPRSGDSQELLASSLPQLLWSLAIPPICRLVAPPLLVLNGITLSVSHARRAVGTTVRF